MVLCWCRVLLRHLVLWWGCVVPRHWVPWWGYETHLKTSIPAGTPRPVAAAVLLRLAEHGILAPCWSEYIDFWQSSACWRRAATVACQVTEQCLLAQKRSCRCGAVPAGPEEVLPAQSSACWRRAATVACQVTEQCLLAQKRSCRCRRGPAGAEQCLPVQKRSSWCGAVPAGAEQCLQAQGRHSGLSGDRAVPAGPEEVLPVRSSACWPRRGPAGAEQCLPEQCHPESRSSWTGCTGSPASAPRPAVGTRGGGFDGLWSGLGRGRSLPWTMLVRGDDIQRITPDKGD
ncbi:hypothetical protein NDU88_007722 [Pleurodeles waltl]|uniref:Uncharacterized protein n=1 Tax=Pleurodeles waltl TaxID=8319 RepID=A0AAV7U2A5_PLEWA|nr:hypothetical protein NDU88_007722 [Pleurodeles waltl]